MARIRYHLSFVVVVLVVALRLAQRLPTASANLIVYWPLNEGASIYAFDHSPSGAAPGILTGSTVWYSPNGSIPIGPRYFLDRTPALYFGAGAGGQVNSTVTVNLQTDGAYTAFSYALWVWADTQPVGSDAVWSSQPFYLIGQHGPGPNSVLGDAGSTRAHLGIGLFRAWIQTGDVSGFNHYAWSRSTYVTNHRWYHLVLSYPGGRKDTATLYVDGDPYAIESTELLPAADFGWLLPSGQVLQVGRTSSVDLAYPPFRGFIKDVRAYDHALSAAEAMALYLADPGNVCTGNATLGTPLCANGGTCTPASALAMSDGSLAGHLPYSCACTPPFSGATCETDGSAVVCSPNGGGCTCAAQGSQCQNGATCDDSSSFRCICPAGFTGFYCETNVDECALLQPCRYGAGCTDLVAGYLCTCTTAQCNTASDNTAANCISARYGTNCTSVEPVTDITVAPVYPYGQCAIYTSAQAQRLQVDMIESAVDAPYCFQDIDLNGHVLEFYSDDGRGIEYGGVLSGHGNVMTNIFAGAHYLIGSASNTNWGGTWQAYGYLWLARSAGATGLNIDTTLTFWSNCGLGWAANDQVADNVTVTMVIASAVTCNLDLSGNNDTLGGLVYSCTGGATCRLNTGAGGVLTVRNLTVEGVHYPEGRYNGSDFAWITGSGALVVHYFQHCAGVTCPLGYLCIDDATGYHCEYGNECYFGLCQHGGQCHSGIFNYTCACAPGYSGSNCQTDINECSSMPCRNGATCIDGPNGFACACVAGYSGVLCQTDINECASAPCANGATCVDGLNSFACNCVGGYVGPRCQTDLDECASSPCANGGTCSMPQLNMFACACVAGYSGAQCQTEINECGSSPCANGGTCTDSLGAFSCACAPGFSGLYCQTNINECASMPCTLHGTCVDGVNVFSCACAPGYSGALCQTEINECASNPCFFSKTCIDAVNGYTCVCQVAACGYVDPNSVAAGTVPPPPQPPAPALVSLTPTTTTTNGGSVMTIVTVGFTGGVALYLSDQPSGGGSSGASSNTTSSAPFRIASSGSGSSGSAFTRVTNVSVAAVANTDPIDSTLAITFTSPEWDAPLTGSVYRTLKIDVTPDDGTAAFELLSTNLLYVSLNPCVDAGEFLTFASDGTRHCGGCPAGGICPGGGRVWPLPGYWSFSEFAPPVACPNAAACPGATGDTPGYPEQITASGAIVTTVCAVGYTGDYCGQCAADYYPLGQLCLSCSLDDSGRKQLELLVAAAVVIFVSLSLGVALVNSTYLAYAVAVVIMLQQFVTVGASAVQRLPASLSWIGEIVSFLSVINFNVQMVKPGCVTPALSFIGVFWATLVLMLVAAVLFALGALLHAAVVHLRWFRGGAGALGGGHHRLGSSARGMGSRAGSTRLLITPRASLRGLEADHKAVAMAVEMAGASPKTGGGGGASGGTASPKVGTSPREGNITTTTGGGTIASGAITAGTPKSSAGYAARAAANARLKALLAEEEEHANHDERDWVRNGRWQSVAAARLTHSMLILVTLVFLKLLETCLDAVHCELVPDSTASETSRSESPRLVIDLTVVCYTGAHLPVVIIAYFLIATVGMGFPALAAYLLYRAFAKSKLQTAKQSGLRPGSVVPEPNTGPGSNPSSPKGAAKALSSEGNTNTQLTAVGGGTGGTASDTAALSALEMQRLADERFAFNARRADYYGFMFRGLTPKHYYFRLLTFPTNWAFVLQDTLSPSIYVRVFIPGVFFLVNSVGCALLTPFVRRINNVANMLIGLGGVAQVMLYLGLLGRTQENSAPSNPAWTFLYWLLALSFVSFALVAVYLYRRSKRLELLLSKQKQMLLDAAANAAAGVGSGATSPAQPLSRGSSMRTVMAGRSGRGAGAHAPAPLQLTTNNAAYSPQPSPAVAVFVEPTTPAVPAASPAAITLRAAGGGGGRALSAGGGPPSPDQSSPAASPNAPLLGLAVRGAGNAAPPLDSSMGLSPVTSHGTLVTASGAVAVFGGGGSSGGGAAGSPEIASPAVLNTTLRPAASAAPAVVDVHTLEDA